MALYEGSLQMWKDGISDLLSEGPQPLTRCTVIWHHDESTFYANDRRKVFWVHKNETAILKQKGDGASLMVADFVSTDYGWLCSPNQKESAHILFHAGKAQDGYFTFEEILKHAEAAMQILEKYYPDENHVLVFDNATTHLKRAADSLSAHRMPKTVTKPGAVPFGVDVPALSVEGKLVYGENGKVLKKWIPMVDGKFADGTPQAFYFPQGHECAGAFKGMAAILAECGLTEAWDWPTQCLDFKCPPGPGHSSCCCHRVLYSQPDFMECETLLETACRAQGFDILYLPKFHCKLNFIEQCWGYAKQKYREFPLSSREADLECNIVEALNSVPLLSMHR